ncbi:MAG TPA: CmpA/NrtA family ABC transporter substrate-binding protein [Burkholderiaceae bacterium]|nr:CmpA/NrtA family ABC transporter substrate-binding protein [Burkholderiaceae bacterium]
MPESHAVPIPPAPGASDAPEKRVLRVGFMPLADCASVVIAAVNGFDERFGIRIIPTRESSWAAIRDKLASGALDAAHALYGLVYGAHLGIAGPQTGMAVLMTLNRNGQAITLSRRLAGRGAVDGPSLARLIAVEGRRLTFAQTFPTGTHAMWLYYWLAAQGIHPLRDVDAITVPPPRMVEALRDGRVDGACVGEPWNHRAIADGVGITAITSQEIWPDHPEKVLATTARFAREFPRTAMALTMALLEASRWIEAAPAHRVQAVETVAGPAYVDTAVDVMGPRFLGHYQDGLGRTWDDPRHMTFFDGGNVNYPYLSDAMWFLSQLRRWGMLRHGIDYAGIAQAVNRADLYAEAATRLGVAIPASPLRTSTLIDGVAWDGRDPERYARSFAIGAVG